jgi:hypothetical protein
MDTRYELLPDSDDRIVYVRPVKMEELPEEIKVQAEAQGADKLYAVHSADGERLALVRDERLAFVLARQNDLAPVYVN